MFNRSPLVQRLVAAAAAAAMSAACLALAVLPGVPGLGSAALV
ncbi:hypothetical protein [Qipengyuania thermophila]|nr:hypothetical protein [Qipengyuania thermophila]